MRCVTLEVIISTSYHQYHPVVREIDALSAHSVALRFSFQPHSLEQQASLVDAGGGEEGVENIRMDMCEGVQAHVVEVGAGRLRGAKQVHPEEAVVRRAGVVFKAVHLLGERGPRRGLSGGRGDV